MVVATALLGCATGGPDPRIDELNVRLATVEANLDRQELTLDQLIERLGGAAESLVGVEQYLRMVPAANQQLGQLSDRASELAAKLERSRHERGKSRWNNPDRVYSVAIDGDPFDGPRHAKVTLVFGFEFA